MKRRTRFITGLSAAILTFGILTASIGPPRYHHHRMHPCHTSCENNINQDQADHAASGPSESQTSSPAKTGTKPE